MMRPATSQDIDLLKLHKQSQANQINGFCGFTKQLHPDILISSYHYLMSSAPRRHDRNLKYFVGHTGKTSSGSRSNRREEHLAVALWNDTQDNGRLRMPDMGDLELLDYQFPLKARRDDKGVGKVDLFGVVGRTKPSVVELKIHSVKTGISDTPLRAFLEALAYCAIVEANAGDIAQEALDKFGCEFTEIRPALIVMATEEYWSSYLNHQKAGDWWSALHRLAESLEKLFYLESHFIVLRDADFGMGLEGQKPKLLGDCSLTNLADLMS